MLMMLRDSVEREGHGFGHDELKAPVEGDTGVRTYVV
jgi:hypothetical protein